MREGREGRGGKRKEEKEEGKYYNKVRVRGGKSGTGILPAPASS